MGDVPAFCRDLVLGDPVFHLWAANPRPAFTRGEEDVHLLGYLRREVIDIGIPLAVVGSREEQLRVLSRNTKRMSWTVPTRSVSSKLPFRNCSNARNRAAPPGANGAIKVNSETLP